MVDLPRRRGLLAGIGVLCAAVSARCARAQPAPAAPPGGGETFASTMKTAMAKMDRDMMATSSGDPDRDFATMMIPHHQGAIDMAEAELRFGHDPVLRRLAQQIITDQRREIAVMQRALAKLPPAGRAERPMPMQH